MIKSNAPKQNIKQSPEKGAKNKQKKKPRPPKKITESYLHNSGLYYLQRFAASSEQFRKVMRRKIDKSCHWHKDQNKEECYERLEKLVEKFQELGLLNDDAYARGMVESLRRRGLSAQAVRQKLRVKGVETGLIQKYLTEHSDRYDDRGEADYIAALRLARRKRIGPFNKTARDDKQFQREMGAMARAGFGYDIVKKVLETEQEAAEDLIARYD